MAGEATSDAKGQLACDRETPGEVRRRPGAGRGVLPGDPSGSRGVGLLQQSVREGSSLSHRGRSVHLGSLLTVHIPRVLTNVCDECAPFEDKMVSLH